MNNKNAVRKNLTSNIVLFFLNGVIGFWLPPYLVKKLGVGAYGVIPLATTIISYGTLFTVGINGSLSRFLVIDMYGEDSQKPSITFNTALTSVSVLLLLLLPFLLYFSFNINSFISIPQGMGSDASLLFFCVSIAFILTSFSSIFNTSAYVANRLDLVNQVTVINTFVRVLLILFIYLFIHISLHGYGIAVVFGSIASTAYSFYLFRKYTPSIKIDLTLFNRNDLKELLSMGGWLTVIQLGSILFLQTDLLVINKILGNFQAGRYSIILQWSTLIGAFSLSLSGVLGPLILNLYAKKEFDQMVKVTKLSNKLLTLFITVLVSVLLIISANLLRLWISPEFSNMKWLFIAVLLPLPLNLGVQPLFSLNRAYNKVKIPGLVTLGMGVANLILAVFFVKYTSLGLYGIAIAIGIVLTIKNFLFMPIYVAMNMGISKWSFIKTPLKSLIILFFALILAYVSDDYIHIKNWLQLIFFSGFLFLFFSGFAYLFLTKDEKSTIISTFLKKGKHQKTDNDFEVIK